MDHCIKCGSDELWSNFFDAEGFGVPDDSQPGWEWRTLCASCGTFQP